MKLWEYLETKRLATNLGNEGDIQLGAAAWEAKAVWTSNHQCPGNKVGANAR